MPIAKKYFCGNLFSKACFLSLLMFVLGARVAGAQCGGGVGIFCNPVDPKISTIAEALIVITLYLLSIVGIITLFFMVIAGVRYILSAGNEEKMKSAKNAFCYSGIGLAISVLAYSILFVIQEILNP